MRLPQVKTRLLAPPKQTGSLVLPDGGRGPRQAPVTEVSHGAKKFVDCRGALRARAAGGWPASTGRIEDDGHRLTAGKLAPIRGLAQAIFLGDALGVESELEDGRLAQFPLGAITAGGAELMPHRRPRHTAWLARAMGGGVVERDGGPASQEEVGRGGASGNRRCG